MSRHMAAVAAQTIGRTVELDALLGMRGRVATVVRLTADGLTVRVHESGETVRGVTGAEIVRWIT